MTMNNKFQSQETLSLSIAEAAALLGISATSVYRMVYAQKLKVLSGFGRLRILRSEIDKLLGEVTIYNPRKRKSLTEAGRTV